MAPSNPTGGISIPTGDVGMSNGPGIPPGDESWATSATSPRGRNGDPPWKEEQEQEPRCEGGRRQRVSGPSECYRNDIDACWVPVVETLLGGNPGNNLHVSGLSLKVDTRDLEAAFAKVGRVCRRSLK